MSSSYTVEMIAPVYPDRLFPGSCSHPPEFKAVGSAHIVKQKAGNTIEYDHMVCLACGSSLKATYGGNILVDLTVIMQTHTHLIPMFSRCWKLRQRWTRIAIKLFGSGGWTGRRERVSRLIDPHLTMRLETDHDTKIGRCYYDESYLRPELDQPDQLDLLQAAE